MFQVIDRLEDASRNLGGHVFGGAKRHILVACAGGEKGWRELGQVFVGQAAMGDLFRGTQEFRPSSGLAGVDIDAVSGFLWTFGQKLSVGFFEVPGYMLLAAFCCCRIGTVGQLSDDAFRDFWKLGVSRAYFLEFRDIEGVVAVEAENPGRLR